MYLIFSNCGQDVVHFIAYLFYSWSIIFSLFICDSKALLHCSLFCRISEEEDLHLGTSFSAETNRRDEDADM